jgi:hypothetical protein
VKQQPVTRCRRTWLTTWAVDLLLLNVTASAVEHGTDQDTSEEDEHDQLVSADEALRAAEAGVDVIAVLTLGERRPAVPRTAAASHAGRALDRGLSCRRESVTSSVSDDPRRERGLTQ